MSAPRVLPVLFSGSLPQAIIEGRKTQTRRVITPLLGPHTHSPFVGADGCWRWMTGRVSYRDDERKHPYGQPGALLWVREAHYRFGRWEPVETKRTRSGRQKWRFVPHDDAGVLFEPPPAGFRKGRHHKDPGTPAWHKRLARFMPRSLSRLTLEVTEVRVQRLREISEEDAMAEGVEPAGGFMATSGSWQNYGANGPSQDTARASFCTLWQSINGERLGCSWVDNPWVWCVSFRVVASSQERAA